MNHILLVLLLLRTLTFANAWKNYVATIFEEASVGIFSNTGSLRLLLYDVPERAQLSVWCFGVRNKQKNPDCPNSEVVVNLQQGSIPTVQYTGQQTYPDYITVKSDQVTNVTLLSGSLTCTQISNPVYGTWFVASYLNEKKGDQAVTKINSVDCSYLMQVNVTSYIAESVIDIGTATQFGTTMKPGLSTFRYPISGNIRHYTVYMNCSNELGISIPCPFLISARGGAPPLNYSTDDNDQQVSLNCTEFRNCILNFASPNIDKQHYLNVINVDNSSVNTLILVQTSVCQTLETCNGDNAQCYTDSLSTSSPNVTSQSSIAEVAPGLAPRSNITNQFLTTAAPPDSILAAGSQSQDVVVVNAANDTVRRSNKTTSLKSKKSTLPGECSDSVIMMLREENPTSVFDTSSSLAYQFIDTTIFVSRFDVDQFKDTGGTMTVTAKASLKSSAYSIKLCIQSGSIPSSRSGQLECNSRTDIDVLVFDNTIIQRNFLYPSPGPWFIAFQANCTASSNRGNQRCSNWMTMVIEVTINSCANSACQNGGQCRYYTRGVYLYSSCYCIAGYRGSTCEDDSETSNLQTQAMYTAFLVVSNLAFIPAICIACYRHYFFEAVVYFANMFFSSFYHWCDMSTWSTYIVCISSYASLQFCDFLCSLLSFWVTLMAVAKMSDRLRYVMFAIGLFSIVLPVYIKNTGILTNVVPIIVGAVIVICSWVRVCYKRRECYPYRRRWAFLVPGLILAITGLCLFAFAETDSNYPFTHSAWHLCMALCIVFLLPTSRSDSKVGSSDASSYELDTQSGPSLIAHQAVASASNTAAHREGGSENAACDDTTLRNSDCETCVVAVSDEDCTKSTSVPSRMAFNVDSQSCSERLPLAECDAVALVSEAKLLEIDLSLHMNDEYTLYDEPSINDLRRSPSTLSFLP